MTQRSVPFPLTGYQLPTSSFNRGYQSPTGSFNQGYQSPHQVLSPDRNMFSPVETSFERPESPTLPPELDTITDEKTEEPIRKFNSSRYSAYSNESNYHPSPISPIANKMTDYPRISDDPEAAIVRRARTLNRGKPAKREDQRRKSAAMAGRKSQLEQWSAIELSIIQKEIPPAPTAAMYWSRAMTYGNGGPQGPLRSHTANLVGERLYVFGGCDNRTCFNILYILDMDTLTWTKPQLYSRFIPPPCRAHTSTLVERTSSTGQKYHQLYVFGGGNGPDYFNDVYVLDVETLVWTMPNIKGDKPPKRRAHSACYWNDRVIIIGGGDGVRALDDVYMLNVSDPNQLEWELLEIANSPPIARGYHTCTIVKDKIVLIGGSDGHDCFSDIYILDLVTRRWIQVDTDLKIPRLTHSATLVGSYIFIFGGHNSRKYSQDILLFNLVSMNWERRKVYGSAPKARGYHTAVLYDSRLYILGGYDGKNFFDDVYILELSSCAYLPQITNFEVDI